jgi:hypothetical protein
MSAPATEIESAPQSAHRLVISTLRLYRRYPLLFLILAAVVIVPYRAIVLALTGAGPFGQGSLGFGVSSLLDVTDLALVTPLVSALHVHAVSEVREGREPRLGLVARQGLRVLPVVAAASIVSWLGILVGLLLFIGPGIYLMLRWFVVAQAAAIEHEGWMPALRRSGELTEGRFGHVFLFFIYISLLTIIPGLLIGMGFGHDSTDAASFLVGVIVQVALYSFTALATASMYYDLRVRRGAAKVPGPGGVDPRASGPVGDSPAPGDHSLDPRRYSAEDRPKGWYIDPDRPSRMRYWNGGDPPDWSATTTRTPRKIKRAWEELAQSGESVP